MTIRALISRLAALLGLVVIGQLLFTIWTWQPGWFRDPLAVTYATLWVLAGLAGLSVALPRPPQWPPSLWERLPWLAAGVLLGFVMPGRFSVGFHMLFSGLLVLLAAALRAPCKRYALEALLTTLLTTGVVFGAAALSI